MACAACSAVGVHKMTASTSSRARISSRSVVAEAMPYLRATSSACSSRRLTTAVTLTPSMFARPSRCLMPKAPVPASAIRMSGLLVSVSGPKHEVPDRGVRSGHMVEAVEFLHLGAQGAAHDQPHDQLDALRTGLAHVVQVRQPSEAVRILDQPVEERVVELGVDEARARPLQLVAHAAGTPD